MTVLDASAVLNWVVSAFIGLAFGVIGTWVAHRFQTDRDNIAWEREIEKTLRQLQHERDLLQAEIDQRQDEIEQQQKRQQQEQLRNDLLKGVDNPDKSIQDLENFRKRLNSLSEKIEAIEEKFQVKNKQVRLDDKTEVLVLSEQTNNIWEIVRRILVRQLNEKQVVFISLIIVLVNYIFILYIISTIIIGLIELIFSP